MTTPWMKTWLESRQITANQKAFDKVQDYLSDMPNKSLRIPLVTFHALVDHMLAKHGTIIPNGRGINLGNGEEVYPQ